MACALARPRLRIDLRRQQFGIAVVAQDQLEQLLRALQPRRIAGGPRVFGQGDHTEGFA